MILPPYEAVFGQLADAIALSLHNAEHFTLTFTGEVSQFVRFNRARVRQTGLVQDGQLHLTLMTADRTCQSSVPFTGQFEADWPLLKTALVDLQASLPQLPLDPYVVLPTGSAQSHETCMGELLGVDAIASTLLPPLQAIDFAGIYAGGLSYRGYADSAGQRHWFETTAYTLDYSLFDTDGQAVKGTVAGHEWDPSNYLDKIAAAKAQLAMLGRPPSKIDPGEYRTYLAPAAVAEILHMFSWGGVSEADLQQGNSALGFLQRGDRLLSPKFSLTENFKRTGVPRFNSLGEVTAAQLPIIIEGKLANSLVSSRSAKEYGKPSNHADPDETLRAPQIDAGTLSPDDILSRIGTGLYLSNLHYLNWSDHPNGRITGMTRYACFWVKQGEIVGPIENLRFDDSFYRFFGHTLVDLTEFQDFIPNVDTYSQRQLGGIWTPGILADEFIYTL
ncbi:MAG: metallopeptidase TldD-related protein [Cyanobacteria bacterium P01_D01_bin.44]